jgi:trimethylamine:corrinoid methyltransferase-like protein
MRGAWEKRGGTDIHERALARAREILATHHVAALPDAAERVIADVKRRL